MIGIMGILHVISGSWYIIKLVKNKKNSIDNKLINLDAITTKN